MKRLAILLRFYGALICLFGLACAIMPASSFLPGEPPSLWCRIAGLHLAAMGAYLSLLSISEQPALVRKLMALRVALGAAEISLGMSFDAPLFMVLGGMDLIVSGILFSGLRAFHEEAETSVTQTSGPLTWRRAHDLALQVPPTVEALLGIFAPGLSARFLFGADVVPLDGWFRFSAFQCAYLAAYWWFVTHAWAKRAIVVTAWGRLFVATAFFLYAASELAPPHSHLPLLAGGLLMSVTWTFLVHRFRARV